MLLWFFTLQCMYIYHIAKIILITTEYFIELLQVDAFNRI